jgi:hypothetical protein
MHLDDYVRQVHDQLAATAALGDERTQQIAGTLTAASAPAVRLAILAALSEAADEITAALLDSPGTPAVSVRLDGDDVRVDVTSSDPEPSAARTDDGDASARISLRLSESLKSDVEAAAGRDGVSVNTWLLRAANNALSPAWPGVPGLAGRGPGGPGGRGSGGPGNRRNNNPHHVTGWING